MSTITKFELADALGIHFGGSAADYIDSTNQLVSIPHAVDAAYRCRTYLGMEKILLVFEEACGNDIPILRHFCQERDRRSFDAVLAYAASKPIPNEVKQAATTQEPDDCIHSARALINEQIRPTTRPYWTSEHIALVLDRLDKLEALIANPNKRTKRSRPCVEFLYQGVNAMRSDPPDWRAARTYFNKAINCLPRDIRPSLFHRNN